MSSLWGAPLTQNQHPSPLPRWKTRNFSKSDGPCIGELILVYVENKLSSQQSLQDLETSKGPNSLAKPKNKDHRPYFMPFEFCLQAFLGIFPSPRAYTERKLGIFSSLIEAIIEGQSLYGRNARNIYKSQSLTEREGSEFFEIPEPIQRGKPRNFSKSQSLGSREYSFIFFTFVTCNEIRALNPIVNRPRITFLRTSFYNENRY